MANFCGNCGTRLDPTTGLCPDCKLKTVIIEPENDQRSEAEIPHKKKSDDKRKKTAILVITAILAVITVAVLLICFGTHNDPGRTSGKDNNQNETIVDDTTNDTIPVNALTMSPDKAVDIYMKNKDIWLKYSTYNHPYGYVYMLLDIDMDGVSEMIVSICYGNGHYSDNKYYKIDRKTETVYEMERNTYYTADRGAFDFSTEDAPKLLRSKTDGSYKYLCTDLLVFEETNDYIRYYGTLTVDNGEIYEDILFSEHHIKHSDGSTDDNYSYFADGAYHQISKEKYDEMYSALFIGNEDLDLKCMKIGGNELENATESEQRELLLEAYRAFSHKGMAVG